MTILDRPFLWIRSSAFCYRFALFVRVLLATAFLPTGMVKLLGQRFTLIGPEHPVGAFFEAMYQTGMFWRFIGLTQVVAAILLLIPRLAHLGAAIFVPVIVNIFVVTVSLSFGNTSIVTGLMLLAVAYLCMWDYHRFRPLVTTAPLAQAVPTQRLDRWETAGFVVFTVSLMNVFGMTRSLISPKLAIVFVVVGFAAGLFTLGRFLWVGLRRWRTRVVSRSAVVFLWLLIPLAGCASPLESSASALPQAPLIVFLVRHAEKVDLSEDPELSAAGRERALSLARALRSAEVQYVHSSDFIRTRDTAAPTATEFGLEVQLYDHRDLPGLVEKLRSTGGRHLVVGHSTTTPPAVELLGGEPGPPIDEASEFDRLYIVTISRDGTAMSAMMRYGD